MKVCMLIASISSDLAMNNAPVPIVLTPMSMYPPSCKEGPVSDGVDVVGGTAFVVAC